VRTGVSTVTNTTVSYFRRQFSPKDKSIPFRFVGSWEYAQSLDNFNRLVEISTPEEIKTYDEFLASRPEFTYFQGVNTAFNRPPDLTKADPNERARFNDRFQKGGLAWMVSLAQIELGATMSMYGKMKKPFSVIVVSKFGNEEYLELLTDDLVSHLKSLAKEPRFKEVLDGNRRVDTWTLAYLRRLKLVKDLMVTISEVAEEETVNEMRPWFKELKEHEESLVNIVNVWLAGSVTVETTTTTGEFRGGGRVLGGGQFGTAALSPELIRLCNQLAGRTVFTDPFSILDIADARANSSSFS